MASLLQSTSNTRAILPDSFRYIRSDVPTRLTDADTDWLLSHNVHTVVDLRSDEERAEKPCPLASDTRFTYLSLPVTGGNAIPASPEGVAESYIRMADGRMREIIAAICGADTGVLYFCNAGKDRTGVVSAILMRENGLSDEDILTDYEASGANLREKLLAFAEANPSADIAVITPKREYMRRFLDWYAAVGRDIIQITAIK